MQRTTSRLLNATLGAGLSSATDCFSHGNCFSLFHHLTTLTAGLLYDGEPLNYLFDASQVKAVQDQSPSAIPEWSEMLNGGRRR
jgi:hypothetical protein